MEEGKEFLKELKIKQEGKDRLIKQEHQLLNLITY